MSKSSPDSFRLGIWAVTDLFVPIFLLVRSILAVSPFRKWRMLNMKQLACQLVDKPNSRP